ncbi:MULTISPECIES: DUF1707 and DUF4870 domain-containing protein [unclassified Nocardiopsis]|uniref:DUF1707 and DUF4870 domain-containing protein n=1 Tax=unclassified Nocardiopsis TaxID=2649073 RepID=UPI0013571FFE|nr:MULTISPECIES: DUF1707 and DUF4870 domain-containing protein [unclassified Nocardiopsis]
MQNPQHPARRPSEPQIRLTDAERDATIKVLQEAYGRGQINELELDERTDKAMRAKFGADLVPLTEDLGMTPAGEPRASSPFGSFGGRAGGEKTDPRTPLPSTPAERAVAAVAHGGNYFFPVVAPLVLFVLSDRVSPYVRRQAMEALNFQIFCIVLGLASAFLFFLLFPLLVTAAVALGWVVLPAIATIASLMGRNWRYPMFFRALKDN